MAYIHCHSCDWSQDDFWDFKIHKYGWYDGYNLFKKYGWGYNPIKMLIDDFKHWGFPRWISFDSEGAKKYRHKIKKRNWGAEQKARNEEGRAIQACCKDMPCLEGADCLTNEYFIHSWSVMWEEIIKFFRKFKTQHWWTHDKWKNDPNKWICPSCGKEELDCD